MRSGLDRKFRACRSRRLGTREDCRFHFSLPQQKILNATGPYDCFVFISRAPARDETRAHGPATRSNRQHGQQCAIKAGGACRFGGGRGGTATGRGRHPGVCGVAQVSRRLTIASGGRRTSWRRNDRRSFGITLKKGIRSCASAETKAHRNRPRTHVGGVSQNTRGPSRTGN